jgi:GTPase
LELFNPGLANKPKVVVLNKMDLPSAQEQWPAVKERIQTDGLPVLAISAVTRENVQQLLYKVQEMLADLPKEESLPVQDLVEIEPTIDEKAFRIEKLENDLWLVQGVAVERAAQMTNWDYYEAAMRFQRILRALGIADALREAGVEEGHRVQIAGVELVWGYENALDE